VEGVIATATCIKAGNGESLWQFATVTDVDTFVGLDVIASGGAEATLVGRVELIAGPHDPSILAAGRISATSEARGRLEFRPMPIRRFSMGRGDTPFLISVAGVTPKNIEVLGIRNDLSEYEILNREGDCFVAVRKKDLSGLLSGQDRERWLAYFKRLRCADF
jgi:hypothetical protein